MDISINGARILYTIENVPLLGKINITQTVIVGWLVMAIITVLCIWLGSGLKVTGISRKQAVAEMAVTSLIKFVHNNMVQSLTAIFRWWARSLPPVWSPT